MKRQAKQGWFYRIGEITVQSAVALKSFKHFICEETEADVRIEKTKEEPPEGDGILAGTEVIQRTDDEWIIFPATKNGTYLYVSEDYTNLRLKLTGEENENILAERLIRIALECLLARKGYISVHAACVAVDGEAVAFCGPSGMGKSTRAAAWIEAFDAELISGDRPLIHVGKKEVYGVPWDGKEKCYKNVCYPLRGIYDIRRSKKTYIRILSFAQRRKLLLRQSFMPMWDNETATIQMMNITRLATDTAMYRVFGGPTANDARELRSIINEDLYLKEERDMKAKSGFVLRNVVGEYILMPVGDTISQFKGTMLLNEVSALVWEKLQNPVSRDDLLRAIMSEYDIDEATAAKDLDALLEKLKGYGVVEEE